MREREEGGEREKETDLQLGENFVVVAQLGNSTMKTLDTAQPCHLLKAKLKTFLFSQYFHPN